MCDLFVKSEDGKTLLKLKERDVKEVVIPDSIISIADEAFSYCFKLTSIEIPNSVISIGNGAFSGCI